MRPVCHITLTTYIADTLYTQVIINTEWGAFGDNGCLDFMRTPIDKEIDNVSINPDQHKYAPLLVYSSTSLCVFSALLNHMHEVGVRYMTYM